MDLLAAVDVSIMRALSLPFMSGSCFSGQFGKKQTYVAVEIYGVDRSLDGCQHLLLSA